MPSLARAVWIVAVVASVGAGTTTADAQWSGGAKGGIGQGSFTGQHEFAWQVVGPNTVLFLNRSIGDRFSLQPEAGVSRQVGLSQVGGSTLTFGAVNVDMRLMGQYAFLPHRATQPFMAAGPSLSYRLSCNLEFVTGGLVSNTSCNDAAGFTRVDIGFALGGGVRWKVGPAAITLESRGTASFQTTVLPLEASVSRGVSWAVLAGVSTGIRLPWMSGRRPVIGPAPSPWQPIRVGEIVDTPPSVPSEYASPVAGSSAKPITLTAADADVRSLLLAIAREAGINLVVSTDVKRRTSVSFKDMPADQAIRAIIADAGLSVIEPPSSRALPAVVYYQLAVSVNDAPAEAIAARFGVSSDLARWLVESRSAPPRPEKQEP